MPVPLLPGRVPPVQVGGLAEVRVPPRQDAPEPGPPAQVECLVEPLCRPLVAGAAAGAVHQEQGLLRVGQGHHQRVVPPGAVVGDVHPLLALAGGLDQEAVHVQEGLLEEGRGLVRPDLQTRVVDDVEEDLNAVRGKAATEVSRRGGVGEAARAQGVQQDLVVAQEFQVLQAGAAAHGVVGDSENVIGFVIGQVNLEEAELLVEGFVQAPVFDEPMDCPEAAAGDSAGALGDLVLDVAGGEDGLEGEGIPAFVEAALDSALAFLEPASENGTHLKSSFVFR